MFDINLPNLVQFSSRLSKAELAAAIIDCMARHAVLAISSGLPAARPGVVRVFSVLTLHPARCAPIAANGQGEQQPVGVPARSQLHAVPGLVLRLHLLPDGQSLPGAHKLIMLTRFSCAGVCVRLALVHSRGVRDRRELGAHPVQRALLRLPVRFNPLILCSSSRCAPSASRHSRHSS